MTGEDEKTCPQCAETVKSAANICRFCGFSFAGGQGGRGAPWSNFHQTINAGPAKNSFQSCMGCVGLVIVALFVISIFGGLN